MLAAHDSACADCAREAAVELATSTDGTAIAFWRSGTGAPLLLVHGATADHTTTWRLVQPALEARFTLYTMDRRGRGSSGDGPAYSLAREAEDVVAVVDAIGGGVNVVGHSYGALCAIEAARLTNRIRRLVLYEGVPIDGAVLYPEGFLDRMDGLLAAGDADGMLVALYRDLVQMTSSDIDRLRAQGPAWARRLANVRTIPRELRVEASYRFDAARFQAITARVVLLVGSQSPARELEHAWAVAAALPDARVVVLEGQEHVAMHTAPEIFVREVVAAVT
jgi:pimeloyl-ACP methyl ester carboxylesterase